MKCCPFCGSDDGLYTKTVVRIFVGYDFDGNCEGEIGDREPVKGYSYHRKNGKGQTLYCMNCDKRVGYLSDN